MFFSDRLSRSSAEGSSNLTVRLRFQHSGMLLLIHRVAGCSHTHAHAHSNFLKRSDAHENNMLVQSRRKYMCNQNARYAMHAQRWTDGCATAMLHPVLVRAHVCISAESGSNPQPETLEVESLANLEQTKHARYSRKPCMLKRHSCKPLQGRPGVAAAMSPDELRSRPAPGKPPLDIACGVWVGFVPAVRVADSWLQDRRSSTNRC